MSYILLLCESPAITRSVGEVLLGHGYYAHVHNYSGPNATAAGSDSAPASVAQTAQKFDALETIRKVRTEYPEASEIVLIAVP